MIKKELIKDGNYVLIELWANGKTNYRVQENKYGEEWDWSDYTDLDEAKEEFEAIVAFVEASKEKEAQKKAEHKDESEHYDDFQDKVTS